MDMGYGRGAKGKIEGRRAKGKGRRAKGEGKGSQRRWDAHHLAPIQKIDADQQRKQTVVFGQKGDRQKAREFAKKSTGRRRKGHGIPVTRRKYRKVGQKTCKTVRCKGEASTLTRRQA